MAEGDGDDKKFAAQAVSAEAREVSKQTFISGLDLESERKPPRSRERRPERNKFRSLSEATAGPRILEHHTDLQDLARTLDVRMGRKLAEHKKEFFLAYKTHMYTVQSEIRNMRMRADHEEAKTREDARIRALEGELEWFMTEALRLDEYCKGYKKEVDRWKAKAEALDEDRQFLEDQIKGAKRQNKVLKAAAERARSSAYSALKMSSARQEEALAAQAAAGTLALRSRPSSARGSQSEPRRAQAKNTRSQTPDVLALTNGKSAMQSSGSLPSLTGAAGAGYPSTSSPALAALSNSEETWFVEHIQTLKRSITREQQTVRMLQAAKATQYTRKSEFEELFLKCMDEARKDLSRRRERDEPRRMIESLLSHEEVLVSFYEQLFPHRTGMARGLQGTGDERLLSALPLGQLDH